jgi:hypothetical protein
VVRRSERRTTPIKMHASARTIQAEIVRSEAQSLRHGPRQRRNVAYLGSPLDRKSSDRCSVAADGMNCAATCCTVSARRGQRRARLTMRDRRSSRLNATDVASKIGVTTSTWRAYVARQHPRGNPAPKPDGREELSNAPFWYVSTIESWMARRTGPGKRTDLCEAASEIRRIIEHEKDGASLRAARARHRARDGLTSDHIQH